MSEKQKRIALVVGGLLIGIILWFLFGRGNTTFINQQLPPLQLPQIQPITSNLHAFQIEGVDYNAPPVNPIYIARSSCKCQD